MFSMSFNVFSKKVDEKEPRDIEALLVKQQACLYIEKYQQDETCQSRS